MSNARGREYRRKQEKLKRQKASRQLRESEFAVNPKSVGKHANAPAKCSCHMCGNPRKYNGNGKQGQTLDEQKPTLQENVSEDQILSELELID